MPNKSTKTKGKHAVIPGSDMKSSELKEQGLKGNQEISQWEISGKEGQHAGIFLQEGSRDIHNEGRLPQENKCMND